MSRVVPAAPMKHSPAWVAQTWIAFGLSAMMTALGIYFLPVDAWIRGYLAMGVLFMMGSSVSLTKTLRDQFESEQTAARIDDARVTKLITEHDALKIKG